MVELRAPLVGDVVEVSHEDQVARSGRLDAAGSLGVVHLVPSARRVVLQIGRRREAPLRHGGGVRVLLDVLLGAVLQRRDVTAPLRARVVWEEFDLDRVLGGLVDHPPLCSSDHSLPVSGRIREEDVDQSVADGGVEDLVGAEEERALPLL